MKPLYTAQATAIGGRSGCVATADNRFRAVLATPKELGGKGEAGTNPEQLFAAGYAACFLSALRLVADRRKIVLTDSSNVTASVSIGTREGGVGFDLDAALTVDLPDVDRGIADDLVQEAHRVCPYSEATRGNLAVRISIL